MDCLQGCQVRFDVLGLLHSIADVCCRCELQQLRPGVLWQPINAIHKLLQVGAWL